MGLDIACSAIVAGLTAARSRRTARGISVFLYDCRAVHRHATSCRSAGPTSVSCVQTTAELAPAQQPAVRVLRGELPARLRRRIITSDDADQVKFYGLFSQQHAVSSGTVVGE